MGLNLTVVEIEQARRAHRESLGDAEFYKQPKTLADAKRRVAASNEFQRICRLNYQRSYEDAVNAVLGYCVYGGVSSTS